MPSSWVRLQWLLLACSSIIICWFHFSGLLSRPHYQFVVIVPVLVWILWISRDQRAETEPNRSGSNTIALLCLAICLLGLTASSFLWSPWGAVVCTLGAAFFHLGLSAGWRQIRRWSPAWLICLTLIPLPFGWDDRITVLLRGQTTRVTSQILDFMGILHVSYMNVIEVPSKKLFIADACSGVHSLYVLLAASLFWCLLNHRSILHTLLLMGSTIGVVLFENISRLVIIVAVLGWQIDLSAGPDHAVLGMTLFLASIGLVVSADQFLLFLLPDFTTSFGESKPAIPKKKQDKTPTVLTPATVMFAWAVYGLFPLAGVIQFTCMPGPLPSLASSFQSPPTLKSLGKEGLPERIGNFQRIEFNQIDRVFGDPFGQQSQQWVYANGNLVIQASIDYPFDGFHDSTVCYAQVGWKINSADTVRSDGVGEFVFSHMSRPLEGEAFLLFSQTAQDGKVYARLKDKATGPRLADARNRIQALLQGPSPSAEPAARLPLIQVQLLARSVGSLTLNDREQVSQFFLQLREHCHIALSLPPHNNQAELSSRPPVENP